MSYQTTSDLKERVEYDASDFYGDSQPGHAEQQYDSLLSALEEEARGYIESYWGDETFAEETGRVDEKRATDDAALLMPFPVNDVSTVEVKRTLAGDWDTLDADRWDFTSHRLILANRSRARSLRGVRRSNPLQEYAARATWGDLYAKVRVTYDRGFDPLPPDMLGIQVDIVNRLLRDLRTEQNIGALEPDQIEAVTSASEVLTPDIENRLGNITKPGGSTMSI